MTPTVTTFWCSSLIFSPQLMSLLKCLIDISFCKSQVSRPVFPPVGSIWLASPVTHLLQGKSWASSLILLFISQPISDLLGTPVGCLSKYSPILTPAHHLPSDLSKRSPTSSFDLSSLVSTRSQSEIYQKRNSIKRCSASFSHFRGKASSTTMRHHYWPTRMAKVKEIDKLPYWIVCALSGSLMHGWWACAVG